MSLQFDFIHNIHNDFIELQNVIKPMNLEEITNNEQNTLEALNKYNDKFNIIFDNLSKELENQSEVGDETCKIKQRLRAMQFGLSFDKAIFLFIIKQHQEMDKLLAGLITNYKEYQLTEEFTYLYMKSLNLYAFLLVTQNKNSKNDLDRAKNYIDECNEISDKVMSLIKSNNSFYLYDTKELFENDLEIKPLNNYRFNLDRLKINNLELLAFIEWHQHETGEIEGNHDEFRKLTHQLLERHLNITHVSIFDWIKKMNDMSAYYIREKEFAVARHYLTVSWIRFRTFVFRIPHFEMQTKHELRMHCDFIFAEIAKLWIFYGLQLFIESREKYLHKNERQLKAINAGKELNENITGIDMIKTECDPQGVDEELKETTNSIELFDDCPIKLHLFETNFYDPNVNVSEINIPLFMDPEAIIIEEKETTHDDADENNENKSGTDRKTSSKENVIMTENKKECYESVPMITNDLRFQAFTNPFIKEYENKIPVQLITNTKMAHDLFKHTTYMMRHISKIFNIHNRPLEYINSVFELSEIYGFLMFFEDSIENQYSIQLNRVDILEIMIQNIKENCPHIYLSMSTDILKELIDIQLDLIELNFTKVYGLVENPNNNINELETLNEQGASSQMDSNDLLKDNLKTLENISEKICELKLINLNNKLC